MKNTEYSKKEVSKIINDDKERIQLFNKLSKSYLDNNSDKSLEYAKQSFEIAESINNETEKANSLSIIGNVYNHKTIYDKALEFYKKALELYEIIDDKKGLIKSLENIGLVYRKLGSYDNALFYYLKAGKICENIVDKKEIAESYICIGSTYFFLNNEDKALVFFQKSLEIMQAINDKKGISRSLNNIGVIFKHQKKYDKALEYYTKSLKVFEEIDDKRLNGISLSNIGNLHELLKHYDNAIEFQFKALKIFQEIKDKWEIARVSTNIARHFTKAKNFEKALSYLEQSLKLAKEIKSKELIKDNYEIFISLFSVQNKYEKVLEYYELCSEIKDSIYNEESSNKIAEMQTKYETEKKEREAEIFRLKNVELEEKVLIRTEELRKSNLLLLDEVVERKKAEEQVKKDLEEKKILLQELFHRTKNNMQIISSMLKMQSQYSENEFVHSAFKTITNRIKAMSLVQQKLFQSKELSLINLKEYIEDILTQLRNSYIIKSKNISLKLDLKKVLVLIDSAVPLGLVLNELITNVYKYAFPDNRKGKIIIRLYKEETGTINIHLEDNGVGFPLDFEPEKVESIGFQTIFSLVKYQLHGEVNWTKQNGIKWHIKFKDNLHEKRV
ncbi:MAG: tetratricopeptide repeat protein [Candidatus Cloacimonetes bacterium]|nr:tetratricopeptide repeat protein [Candidatus Cloacimonadota bacterium]